MQLRSILAAALILCGLITVTPAASAAPTVLPSTSSTYAITSTDTFQFSLGYGVVPGVTLTGQSWHLFAPDGSSMSFTRTDTQAPSSSPAIFSLDGSAVSGNTQVYTVQGSLLGHPGDGTWHIVYSGPNSVGVCTAQSVCPTLSVGGKGLRFGPSFSSGDVQDPSVNGPNFWIDGENQLWNQRNTAPSTTWSEPSTIPNCFAPCVDPINEAPDEDPNNAVFFNDVSPPTVSPFTAYTLNYGAVAGCPTTSTSTVNGAWLGATGTAFSQFIYRDGNFLGTTDLRSVIGYATTTEENEGATAAGTDDKSIPYNNAAGTSYQFKVRDSTGEALGVVQWIPSGLCTATIPSILNLIHDENEFQISASQAQCSEDAISFEITLFALGAGSGSGAINVGLYGAQTGAPRIDIVKAQMFSTGTFPSQVYSFERVMPPGAYVAIATADVTGGIGINDYFDAVAFNVPREACGDLTTDLSPVLLAIESSRLNLTSYLDHVDAQLHALDANLTATRGDILDAINNLNVTIVGNVTGNFSIDNATLTSIYQEILEHRNGTLELNAMSFDGLNFDGSFLVLLWLIALLWCLRHGKLLAATAATVGIGMVLVPGPEYIGWVGVLLFTIALWLEAIGMEKVYAKWWLRVKNTQDIKNP